MKYLFYLILVTTALATMPVIAQQQVEKVTTNSIDSSENNTWNINFEDVFENSNTLAWHHDSPTIELSYGISKSDYSHSDYNEKNVEHNNLDLKIGHTNTHTLYEDSCIIEYDFSYLNVRNINRDWAKKYTDDGLKVNAWSIGVHNSDGYGYKLWKDAALILYHSEGFDWTVMNFGVLSNSSDTVAAAANKAAIKLYDNHVRFGKTWESGVKLYLAKGIALDASYQREVVYSRHLFFYGVVSSGVELISQHVLSAFLEDGGRDSKAFLPVASFVLKSALSYGFYELRKDNMNWPIKTAAPFMFETIKVGMTFSM